MFTTSQTINKAQLKASPTTHPPWERVTWGAVPWYELFRYIDRRLSKRGWRLSKGRFFVEQHGYQAGARWFATPPNDPDLPGEMEWAIGAITGGPNIRRFQLYLGVHDPNLGFYSVFGKTRAPMPRKGQGAEVLAPAIKPLAALTRGVKNTVVGYHNTPVRDVRGAMALLQGARNGCLPWARLIFADTMWRDNSVDENIWSLLACHADAIKRSPPLRQMGELEEFRKLCHKDLGG